MYSEAFRNKVMDHYYNVSHSQKLTAREFNIGKTTVSQWKQEDEGKRKRVVHACNNDIDSIEVEKFNPISIIDNSITETSEVEFQINGYPIKISLNQLSVFLRGMKYD